MTKLTDHANILREQAPQIITVTKVGQIFEKLGHFEVVGSVRLDTMYRRDIDIMVFSNVIEKNLALRASTELKESNNFRSVKMTDYQTTTAFDMPLGYFWELIYEDLKHEIWKFDIWYLNSSEKYSEMVLSAIKNFEPLIIASPEKRELILRIKDEYFDGEKYRNGVKGIDIYKAVLEIDVTSVDEFTSTIE